MGNTADYMIQDGADVWGDHLVGICLDDCRYCMEEDEEEKKKELIILADLIKFLDHRIRGSVFLDKNFCYITIGGRDFYIWKNSIFVRLTEALEVVSLADPQYREKFLEHIIKDPGTLATKKK